MGLKKKKNIIILTMCVVVSFILYQLYFFLTITSEPSSRNIIPVYHHEKRYNILHLRSEEDKFINNEGILKGVFYTLMPKYRPDPDNMFRCLKSQERIPFVNVNDDFCDCEDGTDEPSTNACINGTFYCDSQNHKKVTVHQVPSSRVNDGICDCCDGSDEWMHTPGQKVLSQSDKRHYRYYVAKCSNNCK